MNVKPPTWRLRRICPVCEQGSALTLVACPACSAVSVICAEEGSAFLDPHAIAAALAVDPEITRCRSCAQSLLRDFQDASAAQVQAASIAVDEYE